MICQLLIVSGPVGVGKTTVASELSEVLISRNIPHTFVDLDQLRYTYPRPVDDRFGSKLGLQNLQAIWSNCLAAGSRNLILATVLEAVEDMPQIAAVMPHSQPIVCQLWAKPETLDQRVRQREMGAGLDWHLARSLELAAQLPQSAPADFALWTDGLTPTEIAREIAKRVDWVMD